MMLTSTIIHPQSFHPIFISTVSSSSSFQNCTLHLLYSLPPILFLNPYELADADYDFQYDGPENLELPVVAVESDHNASLLLSMPWEPPQRTIELPLHVRYGPVAENNERPAYVYTQVPWPDAFFACPTDDAADSLLLPPMPPSFASSFRSPASIHRIPVPSDVPNYETIRTPVGHTADLALVELGTFLVVFVAFVYLLRVVRRTAGRLRALVPRKED